MLPRWFVMRDAHSGHRHTYDWFCQQGWDRLDGSLVDPMWKASWDFEAEAAFAESIRRG